MQGDPDRQSSAIPFSDDDKENTDKSDDVFEELPATASPEERLTRQRKKDERTKRLLDEGRLNKKEVEALRDKTGSLERELAELRARVTQPPPVAAPPSGKDPFEERLDAVYERQGNAYTAAQAEIKAGTWNEERQRYYERLAREIEAEKTQIHIDRGLHRDAQNRRAENAQQHYINKYPEVYRDQRAYKFAEATFNRRLALGEAPTNDMLDEVMREAITTFKLGPKTAPSASEKSRLSGVSAGGNSGGGRPSDGITLTPELRRMAIAAYSDLPEADAIKKWVNGSGKRLREKKVL